MKAARSKSDVVEEFRVGEIQDATLRVIANCGVQHATMQAIADEAGISKGTLYLYFQNREALIARTVDLVIDRLVERIRGALGEESDFGRRLETLVRAKLTFFEEHQDFFRVYLALADPPLERRMRPDRRYRAYLDDLATLLQSGVREEDIPPIDAARAAVFLSGGLKELVLQRMAEKTPPPIEQDVRFAVEMIFRGLRKERA